MDSATKLIGTSPHGHFAVIPAAVDFKSAENFEIMVNDNGTVLQIAISNYTIDLSHTGCERMKVGKFSKYESLHDAMSSLHKQPLRGRSGATLKFDTPALDGAYHESTEAVLIEEFDF